MVTTEIHDNIAVITLNDGKVNVLNQAVFQALSAALDECTDKKCVVLTGAGKCFSAGLDLKMLMSLNEEELAQLLGLFSQVIQKLLTAPCPVVAALNGHAIAGGAVLSLSCDHVIGPKMDLKVGLSEVAVGMPLPVQVVELARQKLSPLRLTEAVLFGKLYSWEEALEVGYLHEAVEPEALSERALEKARELAALPTQAYRETKALLYAHLPKQLGGEAVGSFLTEQARQHMSGFR